MKKKLLTVLLAVVMVFGVFGLTACGGSNADEDYNYYGIKYEIEDEVKIQALTFQGIYKMFTTAGKYVVYVATEGANGASKADFQAVNKLANDWGITIYHFNPELSGGYAANNTNAVSTNIIKELDATGAASQLKTVQDTLTAVSKKAATSWEDNKLIAINGAESTASASGVSYKGSIAATNSVADGAKTIAAVAVRNPSYGAYTEEARDIPYIAEAYNTSSISTMNLFGDARLHMYNDDNGVDALTDAKEDVFVTVANYAMFAHLMDYNEGYFPVFFGGTWCGNTQAIVKATNEIAKDYGCTKIYFFDPRLEDGTKIDAVSSSTTWSQEKYALDSKAAYDSYKSLVAKAEAAQDAFDLADAYKSAVEALEKSSVEKAAWDKAEAAVTAAEKALADLEKAHAKALQYEDDKIADAADADKAKAEKAKADLVAKQAKEIEKAEEAIEDAEKVAEDAKKAYDAAQAVANAFAADSAVSNVTPDSDADKAYLLDRLIASYKADLAEAKKGTDKDAIAAAQATVDYAEDMKAAIAADKAAAAELEAAQKALSAADKAVTDFYATLSDLEATAGYTTSYSVVENSAYLASNLNTRTADGKGTSYNFNFLYGKFLKDYLNTYKSEWNIQNSDGTERFISITVDGAATNFTRMCVPNIMMFNGEEEGKAELVALAEAEYTYANVNTEGHAEQIAWTEAVKKVFDANPYLTYNPVVVAEEAPAADAGASAGGSSAPAAGGAAEAC